MIPVTNASKDRKITVIILIMLVELHLRRSTYLLLVICTYRIRISCLYQGENRHFSITNYVMAVNHYHKTRITHKANLGTGLGRKPKRAQITHKKYKDFNSPIVEKTRARQWGMKCY